jgi:hypothetical protein
MAQHDYVISNGTGAAVRSDLNNALAAIVSQNSGSTAPSPTYAYQLWADTSTNLLKLRNGANSAWITVGDLTAANLGLAALASPTFTGTVTIPTATISTGAGIPLASAASPAIYFTGDTNTGIYSPGADQFAITTGGSGRVFVDSSGRVGLGTSSVGAKIHVYDAASSNTLPVNVQAIFEATSNGGIAISSASANSAGVYFPRGADAYYSAIERSNTSLLFKNNGNTAVTIDSSSRVGIGTALPSSVLELASDTAPQFKTGMVSNAARASLMHNGSDLYLDTTAGSLVFRGASNAERGRFDSSGRLLVGTSSAIFSSGEPVQIKATGSAYGLRVDNASDSAEFRRYSADQYGSNIILSKSRSATIGSNTIVQSGDLIGGFVFTGANGSGYDQAARIEAFVDGTPGASNDMPGRLVFSTTADGASSPTERTRITNAGALSHSPCSGADIVGNEACGFVGDSTYAPFYKIKTALTSTKWAAQFHNGNGQVGSISMNGSATAFTTSSDYRLKENVVPLTGASARINQLKPSTFNFKADPATIVDGFIAHEAQAVVPECVTGTKDEVDADGNPVYQGIDQSKLVPLLTAALQEALAEIESLKARVTALEP